jgi:hypothetical protein
MESTGLMRRARYTLALHKGVVDFDVLQTFDKMTLVNPMLSYQEKLDITMESQRNLQSVGRCRLNRCNPC